MNVYGHAGSWMEVAAAYRYSETERVRGKLVLRVHEASSADEARQLSQVAHSAVTPTV